MLTFFFSLQWIRQCRCCTWLWKLEDQGRWDKWCLDHTEGMKRFQRVYFPTRDAAGFDIARSSENQTVGCLVSFFLIPRGHPLISRGPNTPLKVTLVSPMSHGVDVVVDRVDPHCVSTRDAWSEVVGFCCFTPRKTNMSPENRWLEDVFPTEMVTF